MFEKQALRTVFRLPWRLRSGELRKIGNFGNCIRLVAVIKRRRLRWAGHVLRREENKLTESVLKNKQEGGRKTKITLEDQDQALDDARRLGTD